MSSECYLEIEITESPTSNSSKLKFIQNFEEKLHDYDTHHQGSFRKPWTKERILQVISYVKHARVSMIKTECRTSMSYYWLSKYDFMTSNNEEYLIFKRKNPEDPIIRIIPREEYFNILSAVHEELGHGGRDKMASIIKSQYYITKKAIEIFVSLCPTCNTKRNIPKKGTQSQDFNIQGQFDLIDFEYCPDGEYKWVLNYHDNATKFLYLRPLKTNKPSEVAMELMKLFLSFGAPCYLQSDIGQEFTESVIKELVAMWPDCKTVYGSSKHPQTQDSVECSNEDVENIIRSWMTDKNSTNWSVGCFFCQYQKNTSLYQINGKSPYKLLFGSDPKAFNSPNITPHKRLKRPAENMLENTAEELPSEAVGNSVLVSTPKAVCGHLDTKNIKQTMAPLMESSELISNTSIPLNTINVKQELDPLMESCDGILNTSMSLNTTNIHSLSPLIESSDAILSLNPKNIKESLDSFIESSDGVLNTSINNKNIKQELDPLMNNSYAILSTSISLNTKNIKQEMDPLMDSDDDNNLNTSISLPVDTINIKQELHPLMESCDNAILNTSLSLRETITNQIKLGKGFQKCWCKSTQLKCRTMRCTCFRNRLLCGSKCHSSSSCVNV